MKYKNFMRPLAIIIGIILVLVTFVNIGIVAMTGNSIDYTNVLLSILLITQLTIIIMLIDLHDILELGNKKGGRRK